MILWDEILEKHNIRIRGEYKSHVDKYLEGGKLPNQNVTVEQAELYIITRVNSELSGTGYHCFIHIFSFPKKKSEEVPLVYKLWIGPLATEPVGFLHFEWWERDLWDSI